MNKQGVPPTKVIPLRVPTIGEKTPQEAIRFDTKTTGASFRKLDHGYLLQEDLVITSGPMAGKPGFEQSAFISKEKLEAALVDILDKI